MLGRTLFLQWQIMNLIFPMEYAIHKRPKKILNKIIGYAGIYQGKWLEMNPLQCACWFGHFDANALYVFFSWVSSLKNPVKKLQLTEGLVCTLTNALCTCERSVKVWPLQAYNRTSPRKTFKSLNMLLLYQSIQSQHCETAFAGQPYKWMQHTLCSMV